MYKAKTSLKVYWVWCCTLISHIRTAQVHMRGIFWWFSTHESIPWYQCSSRSSFTSWPCLAAAVSSILGCQTGDVTSLRSTDQRLWTWLLRAFSSAAPLSSLSHYMFADNTVLFRLKQDRILIHLYSGTSTASLFL